MFSVKILYSIEKGQSQNYQGGTKQTTLVPLRKIHKIHKAYFVADVKRHTSKMDNKLVTLITWYIDI